MRAGIPLLRLSLLFRCRPLYDAGITSANGTKHDVQHTRELACETRYRCKSLQRTLNEEQSREDARCAIRTCATSYGKRDSKVGRRTLRRTRNNDDDMWWDKLSQSFTTGQAYSPCAHLDRQPVDRLSSTCTVPTHSIKRVTGTVGNDKHTPAQYTQPQTRRRTRPQHIITTAPP